MSCSVLVLPVPVAPAIRAVAVRHLERNLRLSIGHQLAVQHGLARSIAPPLVAYSFAPIVLWRTRLLAHFFVAFFTKPTTLQGREKGLRLTNGRRLATDGGGGNRTLRLEARPGRFQCVPAKQPTDQTPHRGIRTQSLRRVAHRFACATAVNPRGTFPNTDAPRRASARRAAGSSRARAGELR